MIETVGIIGAGTMGNGIPQVCAAAGPIPVMVDVNDAAVTKGLAVVRSSLDRLVKKEKMTIADREATLVRITATTDKAKLVTCDLVIEATTEDEDFFNKQAYLFLMESHYKLA
jgi:3-hydroxybutyryl-CoA dehydrogenase